VIDRPLASFENADVDVRDTAGLETRATFKRRYRHSPGGSGGASDFSPAAFAEDPGGHAAVVLHNCGLEWVDLDGIQFFGEAEEHWLVD
jgi:hypothetical protein